MKKVLLTGATGFIGPHLSRRLREQGFELWLIIKPGESVENLENLDPHLVCADLTDLEGLKKAINGLDFDYVFHLAGLTRVPKMTKQTAELFYKINVAGTRNLLECLKNKPVKKFIYFSSIDVSGFTSGDSHKIKGKLIDEFFEGNPKRPYEISKAKAEELVKLYRREAHIPAVIIRPAIVYGEGRVDLKTMRAESQIFRMCSMIKKGFYPIFGGGGNHFPLIHVGSVVEGVLLAAQSDRTDGQTYILAEEKTHTLNELVGIVAEQLGASHKGLHLPLLASKIGAAFLETIFFLLRKNPPITRSGIDYWTSDRIFSVKKAKEEFGYQPIGFREGIRKTINWYKENNYL